jgi:hypothetical protein
MNIDWLASISYLQQLAKVKEILFDISFEFDF